MRTACIALVILIVSATPSLGIHGIHGSSPSTGINRIFYLSSAGSTSLTLSSSPPSGSGAPSKTNITRTPATFALQTPLLSSATILGQPSFSVWSEWTGNLTASPPALVGTFSYRLPGNSLANISSAVNSISPGLSRNNFTLTPQNIALYPGTLLSIQIAATSLPRHSNVTIAWGSGSAPSLVLMPLIGYASVFQVAITNRDGVPTTYFNINATPGNNVVLVNVLVNEAFGCNDIAKVNMTIVDPLLRPAIGAASLPMEQTPQCTTAQSQFNFIAAWPYTPASPQETYQVWIDVIDAQGNDASSSRGPASFGLVPPGFIPPPYNLVLYIVPVVGGVGVVGGLVYYNRKRGRSYLAPFEHFNSLTAGELDGGTVSIEGNTGAGKTILSEQLMFEDLKRGKPCVFVSTSDFPSNVRSGMKSMGLDTKGYEQSGLLTFVDGYSSEAGQESTEKFSVPSIGDLTTLGIKISSSIPPQAKGASLYFDSLVPLASKTKPESIVSFVQSVGAKMKGIGGKAVFTLGPSVDPTVQKQLEDMSDCVVQMEAFEERGVRRRRLKIAKLRARRHQEGWNVFAIEDGKGIIFYSKKPKT